MLGWLSADDPAHQRAKAESLRWVLLLTIAADFWMWAGERASEPAWVRLALPGLLTLCFAIGCVRRHARAACAGAAAAVLAYAVWNLPFTGNHPGLYVLCTAAFASFDLDDADEREVLLNALRWLTVIVLFYTGLQKVLAGTYFGGEFLAYSVATLERFELVFGPMIPAAEMARLQAIGAPAVGAGPYRIDSLPFVVVSNLAYLGEMGLALLLIPRLTRSLAALGGVALLVAIELAARELFFGVLFVNLLLLFLPGDVNRRLLPLFALLIAIALIATLGFGAQWDIT